MRKQRNSAMGDSCIHSLGLLQQQATNGVAQNGMVLCHSSGGQNQGVSRVTLPLQPVEEVPSCLFLVSPGC